jgi:hypothetical protein
MSPGKLVRPHVEPDPPSDNAASSFDFLQEQEFLQRSRVK